MSKVYFIGAGPGDPELLTVKGQRIINSAEVIVYAGSLVNKEVLAGAMDKAEIHDSAYMAFEEVMAVLERGIREGKTVARVHTGDPAIYGAIQEQMNWLEEKGIDYEVIPGVSSFLAAAAALKQEYTLPEVTQTVMVTRMEGRTPVPEKEKLASLAKHGATICIFLSVGMIEEVVKELQNGYSDDTPIVVAQRVSWPDQKIVRGTLADIASKVKAEKITKTALIIVSPALKNDGAMSKLYDKTFTHEYRKGREED